MILEESVHEAGLVIFTENPAIPVYPCNGSHIQSLCGLTGRVECDTPLSDGTLASLSYADRQLPLWSYLKRL